MKRALSEPWWLVARWPDGRTFRGTFDSEFEAVRWGDFFLWLDASDVEVKEVRR